MVSRKTFLIIVSLGFLLACVLVLRLRPGKPVQGSTWQTSRSIEGPWFEVQVEKPLLARPPWEIPGAILGSRDPELSFDHASPGARIGSVAPDHLGLSADGGWDLLIETDRDGRVAPGTRLVFPIELGHKRVKLQCRAADRPVGYLHTTTRAGSDELDGSFFIEVPNCKNAESGKHVEWPSRPLKIRGSFVGLVKTKDEG